MWYLMNENKAPITLMFAILVLQAHLILVLKATDFPTAQLTTNESKREDVEAIQYVNLDMLKTLETLIQRKLNYEFSQQKAFDSKNISDTGVTTFSSKSELPPPPPKSITNAKLQQKVQSYVKEEMALNNAMRHDEEVLKQFRFIQNINPH